MACVERACNHVEITSDFVQISIYSQEASFIRAIVMDLPKWLFALSWECRNGALDLSPKPLTLNVRLGQLLSGTRLHDADDVQNHGLWGILAAMGFRASMPFDPTWRVGRVS